MTKGEFCRLTGAKYISDADFDVVSTLYMEAGAISKEDFCQYVKNAIIVCEQTQYARTPVWMDEVVASIERREAENGRLRAAIKDLEEAAKKREEEILAAGLDLRGIAGKRGIKDLADIAIDLIGAERSAFYAAEKGLTLIKEEQQAVTEAIKELTEIRGLRDEVTREGERSDAAAAAEADS